MTLNYTLVRSNLLMLLGCSALLIVMGVACAESLPKPTGKILLTVSGDISVSNSNAGAQFDYKLLSQLGLIDKVIATQWTGPVSVFSGVLTRELMRVVGAKGNWVRAVAANDYSVNIPLTDLTDFETLLALSHNGERLKLRDKGPLWILYPNDSRPDELASAINQRMVWQLKSLHIQ